MFTNGAQDAAARLVDAVTKASPDCPFSFSEVKDLSAVRKVLEAEPEVQLAVVHETIDRLARVAQKCRSQSELWNIDGADSYPGAAIHVVGQLLRRKLPWTEEQLVTILNRQANVRVVLVDSHPHLRNLISGVENYVKTNGVSDALANALRRVAKTLDFRENNAPERKLLARLEALRKTSPTTPVEAKADPFTAKLAAAVLDEYERRLRARNFCYGTKLEELPSGKRISTLDAEAQSRVVHALLDRVEANEKKITASFAKLKGSNDYPGGPAWLALCVTRDGLHFVLGALLRRALPIGEADVLRLLRWPVASSMLFRGYSYPLTGIAAAVERFVQANGCNAQLGSAIEALIATLQKDQRNKDCRKVATRLLALSAGGPAIRIEPGEAWSDAALADLKKLPAKEKQSWNALLVHCQSGGRGKCTDAWRKDAEALVKAAGFAELKKTLLRWFPLVDKPRTQPRERQRPWYPDYTDLIVEPHVELLRGLVWCCGLKEDSDLARAVARLALSAYRKIPGKGPRLVSLGNACVTALGMMPGRAAIGQLAVLKVKVKFGTAQKEIEKALDASAAREGLPRDEIEELAVPAYGLDDVGLRRESLGDYQAGVSVDGSSAVMHWFKDRKPLKSVPAAVKKDHPEEFKELQASLKDLNAMLPAQRERIDTLFLAQKRWPITAWRERYLDHPLVGTIVRRLIWSFAAKDKTIAGVWHGGEIVGVDGKALRLTESTTVSLWHPIGRPLEEILAWRQWFERHEVVQPFKQAHREVYLLTDAERRTRTYSNRFAAHILRQHQFHALCAARGWKNKLRLMVDAEYPPAHRLLPAWNLRAEFWVEGAGTNYGQDTNAAGAYLYLATDQVRFYALGAAQVLAHAGGGGYGPGWNQTVDEPLALEAIPPLVFSEIMRDVDLFVGVASVGNDPNWADGGLDGRYRDYWQDYSFGELSATAQTRRALLEQLIPRLKVADRCTLSDRFLLVRGDLRSYKIHLGSANILMMPNDQYLCIVAKQAMAGGHRVFLPFEGDATLSIILSKAFLLAEDSKITDPSIVSQLKR